MLPRKRFKANTGTQRPVLIGSKRVGQVDLAFQGVDSLGRPGTG
jgi:hypothetical protein